MMVDLRRQVGEARHREPPTEFTFTCDHFMVIEAPNQTPLHVMPGDIVRFITFEKSGKGYAAALRAIADSIDKAEGR